MQKIADSTVILSAAVPAHVAAQIRAQAKTRKVKVSEVIRDILMRATIEDSTPMLEVGNASIPLSELSKARIVLKK